MFYPLGKTEKKNLTGGGIHLPLPALVRPRDKRLIPQRQNILIVDLGWACRTGEVYSLHARSEEREDFKEITE